MQCSVDVIGDGTRTVSVPETATIADLVEPLPVSIHEVAVVVDGKTLPADASLPRDAEDIRVIRLIKGG
ncbi:MAG: small archaeal modifier protein 2 [Salinirussus sp.]